MIKALAVWVVICFLWISLCWFTKPDGLQMSFKSIFAMLFIGGGVIASVMLLITN